MMKQTEKDCFQERRPLSTVYVETDIETTSFVSVGLWQDTLDASPPAHTRHSRLDGPG